MRTSAVLANCSPDTCDVSFFRIYVTPAPLVMLTFGTLLF